MGETYNVQIAHGDDGSGGSDEVAVQIWNPSALRSIALLEVACFSTGTNFTTRFRTRRSTVRGTPASTVTPTSEHHNRRQAAPDSGFLIDIGGFSVQPTLVAGNLHPVHLPPASPLAGHGALYPLPRGIDIPPSTGLCFVERDGSFGASEWHFVVEEL